MIVLGENEQRLLSELEEAGEQDLVPLINTIQGLTGTNGDLDRLRLAIQDLLQRDFVAFAMMTFSPRSLSVLSKTERDAVLMLLGEWLEFGAYGAYWHYRKSYPTNPYPGLILTDLGLEHARAILRARGYRWWVQRADER